MMALAVQQSLLTSADGTALVESGQWLERLILGEIALALCLIAVAFFGALMLTGRVRVREGLRTVVGCFVLLGAPVITAGLMRSVNGTVSDPAPPVSPPIEPPRTPLPPSNYDPYAGASLGKS